MKDIEKDFKLNWLDEKQIFRISEINECAKSLAAMIESACPDGREKALAYTKLEECVMWARAAIAKER